MGFKCLKTQAGRPGLDNLRGQKPMIEIVRSDARRIKALREAVGDEIEIGIDAQCRLDLTHAMELVRLIEPYHVDFSTVKVDKGRAFAARLREATGCGWVDAPVSGGPPASGTGTLTVMAGGDAADIARVAPLMARRVEPLHAHGPGRRGRSSPR